MRDSKVLGFMGYSGVGKTTAARALHSDSATILSFASPLKAAVKDLFLFSDAQVYGDKAIKETVDPRWGVSPREVLQKMGTECVRNMLVKDFWVRRMREEILADRHPIIIIDDVRFEDEALLIREMSGICFNIVRTGAESCGHASENPPVHLAYPDNFHNEGTEGQFKSYVRSRLKQFLEA